MSYGNSRPQNQGADIFTPVTEALMEIIHNILVLLGRLAIYLGKKAIRAIRMKYFGIYYSFPVQLKHLRNKKQTKTRNALGYSCNNRRVVNLSELNTQRHTAVIGATGSGKTVCLRLLMDHALRRGMPVIYFDPKPNFESIEVFKKMCASQGKRLYLFTDISEETVNFNPLADGTLDEINDRIINSMEWSEPFYKNESIRALDDVLEVLSLSHTAITIKNIVTELEKHPARKNITGLINQLLKVSKGSLGHLLDHPHLDQVMTFNQLRTENACLYIGISAMGHSSSGSILNKLFFGGLLTHAKDSLVGRVPRLTDPLLNPISVVFDELSSTIHEGFIDLQNKCRQAGIEITYATQGPSDIDRLSPSLTAQIFENTNNLFVFNQIVPAHTEFFARAFGTTTSEKKTHVIENDSRQAKGTVREVEEFMVHSNIFRGLRVGQCVLLQRTPKRVDLLNINFWNTDSAYTSANGNTLKAKSVI